MTATIAGVLLLRSDVHVMFDHGYVGVDPSYRLKVSPRLRSESGNGDSFYAKAGEVKVMADQSDLTAVVHVLHQVLNYKGTSG